MSYLPEQLISSLQRVAGFDERAFRRVHDEGRPITSVRINHRKFHRHVSEPVSLHATFPGPDLYEKVPWSAYGYYLKERPLFYLDPLWHAGAYYVQEPSSMSLEFVIKNSCDTSRPLRVLDLCAAPGGKTTLLTDLLSPESILVANEVIASRVHILEENVVKWGAPNVVVTQQDAQGFGRMKSFFDVIIVDAPCSGSGLFRKDPGALKEWSPEQVIMCSRRQKRILADVMPALKKGGLLVYSTCSFSPEENEDMADFLVQEFGLFQVEIPFKPAWNITTGISPLTRSKGYRFYPDKLSGEGFFIACFQNGKTNETGIRKDRFGGVKNIQALSSDQSKAISPWLEDAEDLFAFFWKDELRAIPRPLKNDLELLCRQVNVRAAGSHIGKLIREKLIPGHGLAMNVLVRKENLIDLGHEEAVQYLRRAVIDIPDGVQGWALAAYKHYPLGWLKAAGGRVNNYYPMSWRIRKSGEGDRELSTSTEE